MKKYKVNVNGTAYEITLEVVDENEAASAAPAAPAPVAVPAPVAPVAAPAPAPAGGETVNSPMPGTILAVNVTAGQSVKKGDVLVVLEAMKMENEIQAARDGVVASVAVTKGATVETGAVLVVLQ